MHRRTGGLGGRRCKVAAGQVAQLPLNKGGGAEQEEECDRR
jgi:hypothetical protein